MIETMTRTVEMHLEENELQFTTREMGDGESNIVELPMKLEAVEVHLKFVINEETRVFNLYAGIPIAVPEDRRKAVAEKLNELNWRTVVGNWEMDKSDGELMFRIGVPMGDAFLTSEMVLQLIGRCLASVDSEVADVLRVIFSQESEPEVEIETLAEEIFEQGEQIGDAEELKAAHSSSSRRQDDGELDALGEECEPTQGPKKGSSVH